MPHAGTGRIVSAICAAKRAQYQPGFLLNTKATMNWEASSGRRQLWISRHYGETGFRSQGSSEQHQSPSRFGGTRYERRPRLPGVCQIARLAKGPSSIDGTGIWDADLSRMRPLLAARAVLQSRSMSVKTLDQSGNRRSLHYAGHA